MTSDNLVLELLKKIQHDIAGIKADIRDLKLRSNSLEAEVRNGFFHLGETAARQQLAIDRIDERFNRIEDRLNLID